MAAPRFMLQPQDFQHTPVQLSGADAQHAKVLRLKTGDEVRLCDGQGHEWIGRISGASAQAFTISELQPLQSLTESPLNVVLYQGLARGDKLEWIMQKATELGVARVVPVVTARSQVHLKESGSNKQKRWQEIVRQAARQSGRTRVPEVSAPATFTQAVSEAAREELALIPFEHANPELSWKTLLAGRPRPGSVALLVGPEGGFAETEIEQARAAGIVPVSLGPRILRSETAGLAVVAMALFQWGDLGGGG